LCVIDDRSRLACHIQWYLDVTTKHLVHGFSQALMRRALPRAVMTDNGSAMISEEFTNGLHELGILHQPTLPRTPWANGKQERLWGTLEGRLMAMLEGEKVAVAGVDFENLDVHLITVPALRLDRNDDRQALAATVALLRPKLLVLDPFVRLHCIDENAAAEVAPLLAYLRHLQRDLHTAVALVHHARKGAAHERGGQALRGSSEFHAWGDSNAFLRRIGGQLQLSIEHCAAPGRDWMPLVLKEHPPALEVVDQQSHSRLPS
jgi:transposase InsO family protein